MALRTPPLRGRHEEAGGSFTDFGGWEMPVEFAGIRTEHEAVREAVGIFDVSHMGEVEVYGPDATKLMQRLTTNDVTELSPGDSQYACITDEEGVILDDTVVYRRPDEGETPTYLFVPNAGHEDWMVDRWTDHRDEWGLDATVDDRTEEYAMFAVQGPDAVDHVREATENGSEVASLSRFTAATATVAGADCLVARTGYTGEDGFELVVPWDAAADVWDAFDGVEPCGLGARDTLRLEAGLLLSGQDFHHEENPRTPYEAGIGFTVKLDTEFVGRDALEAQKEQGVDEKLVGIRLVDRGIPRHGYDVTDTDGDVVGTVTSGTMSPTLDEPIGLAYVPTDLADPETMLRVVVRERPKKAVVEPLPFYER
ncbi:glycine cleavage system aminomethyltransferase GcvT [Haloarchaeobius litoreus]|uniref:Probable aminomethyltransferase n=1 Tax=Haloarchaeobius litoreus TaxID=755306 RepID=A0ABD6DJ05_9EURY|nr:glycine cleavage system aminomethyltransferase GcvT [Haloarchaeobius litoreus]